jgi:hypothetical protein
MDAVAGRAVGFTTLMTDCSRVGQLENQPPSGFTVAGAKADRILLPVAAHFRKSRPFAERAAILVFQ